MKTRILLFVLAWVLFAPMAAAADQVKVVVEKVDLLRDNKPVATVKKGDVLDVVARRGAWVGVKLTRNGKSILGWIKKAQVEDIVQETPAEIWKRQMKEAEQKAHEQERRERQKYDELQKKEWTWRPIPNGQKPVAIVPKDWDGKAPLARQFGKIQSAINAAENGDEVVIRPGRYRENIDFKGKAITVRSINPADSKVVAGTIIDGNKKGSVVTFQSKEWLDSVLAGLTLTNGLGPMKKYGGEAKPSSSGGGVLCWQASPVLTHCVITRNEAVGGAGILVSSGSPYIGACTISDNDATRGRGGGIFASKGAHPRIHQSRILRNIADAGAGVFSHRSHVTITESMICRNVTNESLTAIMYYNWYQPIRVRNCVIAYNSARSGVSGVAAQGTYDRSPRTFTNCIFWQNGEDLFNCHAQYSCYQTKRIQRKHWKDQPVCLGNVLSAPYFVDPENDDYRLQPWSPCIGSGLGGVNMGAYPHQDVKKSPDTDSDKLPDAWELHHAPDLKALGAGDADKDGVTDLEEYRQGTHPLRDSMHMHVRAGADPKTADGSKEHPFPGVQAGLDAVADGGDRNARWQMMMAASQPAPTEAGSPFSSRASPSPAAGHKTSPAAGRSRPTTTPSSGAGTLFCGSMAATVRVSWGSVSAAAGAPLPAASSAVPTPPRCSQNASYGETTAAGERVSPAVSPTPCSATASSLTTARQSRRREQTTSRERAPLVRWGTH